MRASVALATQAPLLFVVLIVGITSAEEAVGPPNQEATLESTLYGIFDAQELLEKHVSCFDETPLHTNVVTNINVSPSGDDF